MHLILVVVFLMNAYIVVCDETTTALGVVKCNKACQSKIENCTEICIHLNNNEINEKETPDEERFENKAVSDYSTEKSTFEKNTTLSKIVYIVMRKSSVGTWRPSIQSAAFIANSFEDDADVIYRVIVIDPLGLHKVYTNEESKEIANTLINDVNNNIDSGSTNDSSEKWGLSLVDLVHQKILVATRLRWEPRVYRGLYLVCWEIDGGGLKGNLFTTSNHATLSLWPDTIYHIQVELISTNFPEENEKSTVITVNTGEVAKTHMFNSNKMNHLTDLQDEFYAVMIEPVEAANLNLERQSIVNSLCILVLMVILSVALFIIVGRNRNNKLKEQNEFKEDNKNKVIFTIGKV